MYIFVQNSQKSEKDRMCCLGTFFLVALAAQCGIGEAEIIIDMLPDTYPQEISWILSSNGGDTLAVGGSLSDTLCVAEDA